MIGNPTPLTNDTYQAIYKLAQWFISLERLSFDACGSLQLGTRDTISVGPYVGTWNTRSESPYFDGPFPTAKARYLSTIDTMLRETLEGIRFPPSTILLGYLALLDIRCLVSECDELEEGPYYIKHGEDKGDHIFFDNQGDLTGVIDWEWYVARLNHYKACLIVLRASTTCKADAFAAPYGLCDSTYSGGSNELCPNEIGLMTAYDQLGRPDLAAYIRSGKKYQRLGVFLREPRLELTELKAIRRAFNGITEGTANEPVSLKQWTADVTAKHPSDAGIKLLASSFTSTDL
jgi:hypothetical protein